MLLTYIYTGIYTGRIVRITVTPSYQGMCLVVLPPTDPGPMRQCPPAWAEFRVLTARSHTPNTEAKRPQPVGWFCEIQTSKPLACKAGRHGSSRAAPRGAKFAVKQICVSNIDWFLVITYRRRAHMRHLLHFYWCSPQDQNKVAGGFGNRIRKVGIIKVA